MDEFVVTNLPSCCSSDPVGGGTALLATPAAEEYPPTQALAGRRHCMRVRVICVYHCKYSLQVASSWGCSSSTTLFPVFAHASTKHCTFGSHATTKVFAPPINNFANLSGNEFTYVKENLNN
jgi:hypothetical protein